MFVRFDTGALVLHKSQLIKEPAWFEDSEVLESISLVIMSSQGNFHSEEYQTERCKTLGQSVFLW